MHKRIWDQLLNMVKFRARLYPTPPPPPLNQQDKVLKLYPATIHVYWWHLRTSRIDFLLTTLSKGRNITNNQLKLLLVCKHHAAFSLKLASGDWIHQWDNSIFLINQWKRLSDLCTTQKGLFHVVSKYASYCRYLIWSHAQK